MLRAALLWKAFFLFFTLSAAASQEDCVLKTERTYKHTLLKKQPLPKKLKLPAIGGRVIPVTKKDRENFDLFMSSYCKKPEKLYDSVQEIMTFGKRRVATFIGLVPFFKLPQEFLTNFLTIWAETILKTDRMISTVFFDPFYRRLFSPIKNFLISYEKPLPWSKNLKIIGIGGQDKNLIFGTENSDRLKFLDSAGTSIFESKITTEPFTEELQKKTFQPITKTLESESKILINKYGTSALIDQKKSLENFDTMLTDNLSSWRDDDKETLIEDGLVTEDCADIIIHESLRFTNFTNKNDTCLEKEKLFPTIKRPGSFSPVNEPDNPWISALSDNGTVALYKNSFFVYLYKKTANDRDLLDIKKDSEVRKMVFNTDGSLLAIYGSAFHIWQQKNYKYCTSWEEIFTKTIPNISDINFAPKGPTCLVASRTEGAYYISLAQKEPKMVRLSRANIGVSRVIFSPDGNSFAVLGLDRTIKIYQLANNTNKPILLCKFSQKQNANYCGNEAFVDAKFSPYEKNTLVFATEGGWVASWNFMTGKIENFLAYDGLSTAPCIRELFILGPRHILLWLEDGTIKELFALSPAAFFVYKTLTKTLAKKKKVSLTVPNQQKNFKKAPSLFNACEQINQEFDHIGLPFKIHYKTKNIESSFEVYF